MENKTSQQYPAPLVCDNCGALNDPRNRTCHQCKHGFSPEAQPAYQQANYSNYQPEYQETVNKKKSKISLVAMILGILVSLFMIYAACDVMGSTSSAAEELGVVIGLSIVMPAIVLVILGTVLNIIGYFTSSRVLTLISAIAYTLGLLAFPMWGFVAIPPLILQFIAFAKMPKRA